MTPSPTQPRGQPHSQILPHSSTATATQGIIILYIMVLFQSMRTNRFTLLVSLHPRIMH